MTHSARRLGTMSRSFEEQPIRALLSANRVRRSLGLGRSREAAHSDRSLTSLQAIPSLRPYWNRVEKLSVALGALSPQFFALTVTRCVSGSANPSDVESPFTVNELGFPGSAER